LDQRKTSEQVFHDEAFSTNTRGRLSKYYAISEPDREYLDRLMQLYSPGKDILEVGCGPGSRAGKFERNGARRVTAIDLSLVALQQSRETAASEKVRSTHFCLMDAERLGFRDSQFSLIYGLGILHHLDLGVGLPELARVLQPEGTAIFAEPLAHNPFIRLYRKMTPQMRTPDEHPLTIGELRQLKAHFSNVEVLMFHLFTLLAVPFRKFPGFQLLVRLLATADRGLFFLLPFLRRYAWKVVLVLSNPVKS